MAWVIPPAVGMGFIAFVDIFSPGEVLAILITWPMQLLLLASILFAAYYFHRFSLPIKCHVERRDERTLPDALARIRSFPLHFWGLFLLTLVVSPNVVMISAQQIVGLQPQPVDWFRIHLVALIVSILVGLPIFFLIIDLFGRTLKGAVIEKAHITLRTKVFLIGSLVPLLIDTMLVQYYWSRTGYFTGETFAVWLLLELIAVAGSLLFVRSVGQSMAPLQSLISQQQKPCELDLDILQAASTDELGILTNEYRELLQHHMDLTRRLRRSERDLRSILENMQDTYYRTDLEGRIVRITPMVEQSLGYSPEALLGTKMADLYLEADAREQFLAALQANNGVVRNYTAALRHRDGSVVWASTNAHYYRDADGNIAGVEGNARDITALKVAEAAVQHERQRLLATLESIADGVVTTDTDGTVEYINPVAERLLAGAEGAVGQHYSSVLPLREELSGGPLNDLVELALHHEGSFVHASNGLLRRPDGHEYVLKVSVSAMHDSAGRVIGAVLVLHDITENIRMTRQLNYQASHDTLTGLVNRREFSRRLKQAVLSALQSGHEHALFFMDLDQFKVINDTCGHRAGDELLVQLAAQLEQTVRASDTLARLGGDEFAVLLEHCPLEQAQAHADTMRQLIKEFRFVWEGKSFQIGVSIGVVMVNGTMPDIDQLLSAADAACYFAKEQGRNRVYVYREHDDETIERHGEMSWVHRITEAFEQDRLYLDAQHIAPLQQGDELPHYEILLRMMNEAGERVPPMAFIPAAERYNLMPTIDRWVIRTTLDILCRARDEQGQVPIACSINLSGQTLADDHFLDFVTAQLERSGLEPELLCFEITETAAITNLSRAMKLFGELKRRGCRFSLDDFGSGLSSFGYLKSLPVDYLKIDGAFVRDILDDEIDEVMVEAIHKVGSAMELQTIAEFVENEAIAQRLRQMGINYAQGYGVHRPEPIEQVICRHSEDNGG